MPMEIAKTFVVQATPEAVWSFLIDLPRVARCLPGAAIGEKLDDKTSTGTMTIKVGPVSSTYRGKVVFERLDPAARTAEIVASGQDVRGKGGADLRLTSSLKPLPGGQTEVTAISLINVTGLLAQMGRGMIQDVSDEMFQIFSERMRAELERPSGSAGGVAASAGVNGPGSAVLGGTSGGSAASGGVGGEPGGAAGGPGALGPGERGAAAGVQRGPQPGDAPRRGAMGSGSSALAPPGSSPARVEALDAAGLAARVARRSAARWVRQPAFWAVTLLVLGAVLYAVFHRSS